MMGSLKPAGIHCDDGTVPITPQPLQQIIGIGLH